MRQHCDQCFCRMIYALQILTKMQKNAQTPASSVRRRRRGRAKVVHVIVRVCERCANAARITNFRVRNRSGSCRGVDSAHFMCGVKRKMF